MSRAVIWKAPFDLCQPLSLLPGSANSLVWDCSRDGQTLVGWCSPDPEYDVTARRPCKWDKTTLAVTELTAVSGVSPGAEAIYISPDGSIIVTRDYNNSDQAYCRFTSGGAAGTRLAPASGFSTVGISYSLPLTYYGTGVQRCLGMISDDNSTIVGWSVTTTTHATRWIGTSPSLLPLVTAGPYDASSLALSVTADGQRAVGPYNSAADGVDVAVYWQGTTGPRVLYPPHGVPWARGNAQVINAAGTVIWGGTHQVNPAAAGGEFCYWDNLGTFTNVGGVNYYGTPHIIAGRTPYISGNDDTIIHGIAVDATTPIFCGSDIYEPQRALKWTNSITPTDLGVLPGGDISISYSMSGDGSIVVGSGNGGPDAPGDEWGIWWDASLVPHRLPTLLGADTTTSGLFGRATGISRDGSTIFGLVDVSYSDAQALTTAELIFQPQNGFTDLSVLETRRLFRSLNGTPQWVGQDGALPFGTPPAVYLTTTGPPLEFTNNNGFGGSFPVDGTINGATGPGCTPYYITTAAGPASQPTWRLTVSDDGGRTWSTLVKPRSAGATGEYLTRLRWLKLGQSRERMIKLECTDPVRRNIIGVYLDTAQGMS